jgi:hypothetical protein
MSAKVRNRINSPFLKGTMSPREIEKSIEAMDKADHYGFKRKTSVKPISRNSSSLL